MGKISFLMILCIVGIVKGVSAQQQVSKEEAMNAAINTLYNKADVLKVSSDNRIKTVNSLSNANRDTIMYEVVFQNGAAVLLSGSKTCLPVLGYYSKKNNGDVFDPNNDNVPCGLKALLKGYADDIEWGFAQDTICLYHKEKWQELQQYDWCNMSDELYSYLPNYTKGRNAIARLLKDCADAANAVYCIAKCNTSATAIAARSALVNDFGYSNNAVFRLRSSHPINHSNVWIDYLRSNLNAGRPVLYGAIGTDAHYWVCDGYGDDGNGNSHEHVYFHFNFGNTGTYDGWYTIDNITANPHWNNLQEAVFNISPSTSQDYCNFTLPLLTHYTIQCNLLGFPVPFAHLTIPKTATVLESVPAGNGIPASWHTIESGQSVEYVAREAIILKSGFQAKAGSHFVARIEPCADCGSRETRSSLFTENANDDQMTD
ncbi:MAG: C10 family peptidase [Bacteroidales bacterium]|nr:C10 family peptidase [Bacteroidales bacterium]